MSGHELAVSFQRHFLAEPVSAEHLVRFCQTNFPGKARMMNGTHRGSTGAALTAGDENAAGPGLGHAAGNGAHAR